jgi:hypothetical protein
VNLMRALGGGWHDTSAPTAPIARTGL